MIAVNLYLFIGNDPIMGVDGLGTGSCSCQPPTPMPWILPPPTPCVPGQVVNSAPFGGSCKPDSLLYSCRCFTIQSFTFVEQWTCVKPKGGFSGWSPKIVKTSGMCW